MNQGSAYLALKKEYNRIKKKGSGNIFKRAYYRAKAETFAIVTGMYLRKLIFETLGKDVLKYSKKYKSYLKNSNDIYAKICNIVNKSIEIDKQISNVKENIENLNLEDKTADQIRNLYNVVGIENNITLDVEDNEFVKQFLNNESIISTEDFTKKIASIRFSLFEKLTENVYKDIEDDKDKYETESLLNIIYKNSKYLESKYDYSKTYNYRMGVNEYFIILEGIKDFYGLECSDDVLAHLSDLSSDVYEKLVLGERSLSEKKHEIELADMNNNISYWKNKMQSALKNGLSQWNKIIDTFFEKRKNSINQFNIEKRKRLEEINNQLNELHKNQIELLKTQTLKEYESQLSENVDLLNNIIMLQNESIQTLSIEMEKNEIEIAVNELRKEWDEKYIAKYSNLIYEKNLNILDLKKDKSFSTISYRVFNLFNTIVNQTNDVVKLKVAEKINSLLDLLREKLFEFNTKSDRNVDKYAFSFDYRRKGNKYKKNSKKWYGTSKNVSVDSFRYLQLEKIIPHSSDYFINFSHISNYTQEDFNCLVVNQISYLTANFKNYNYSDYVGYFPEYTKKGTLENNGEGEYGRIGVSIYNNEKEAQIYDRITTGVGAAMQIGLTAYNPLAGFMMSQYFNYDRVILDEDYETSEFLMNTVIQGTAFLCGAVAADQLSPVVSPFFDNMIGAMEYEDGSFNYGLNEQDFINIAGGSISSILGNKFGDNVWCNGGSYVSSGILQLVDYDEDGNFAGFDFGADSIASGLIDTGLSSLYNETDFMNFNSELGKRASRNAMDNILKGLYGYLSGTDMIGEIDTDYSYTLKDYSSMLYNSIGRERSDNSSRSLQLLQFAEDLISGLYTGFKDSLEIIKPYLSKKGIKDLMEKINNYRKKGIFVTDRRLDEIHEQAMHELEVEYLSKREAADFKTDTSNVTYDTNRSYYTQEEADEFMELRTYEIMNIVGSESWTTTKDRIMKLKNAGFDTTALEQAAIKKYNKIMLYRKRKAEERRRKIKEAQKKKEEERRKKIEAAEAAEAAAAAAAEENNKTYTYKELVNNYVVAGFPLFTALIMAKVAKYKQEKEAEKEAEKEVYKNDDTPNVRINEEGDYTLIPENYFEQEYGNNVVELTSPTVLGQGGKGSNVAKIFSNVYDTIKMNPEYQKRIPSKNGEAQALSDEDFEKIMDAILNRPSLDVAGNTSRASCCIESYWLYAVATGQCNVSFDKFYMSELLKGNIGRIQKNGKVDLYFGCGTGIWRERYGLQKLSAGNGKTIDTQPYILEILDESGAEYAIVAYDYKNKGYGHHFMVIKKDDNGKWIIYDHNWNDETRFKEVEFDKIYTIYF